MVESSISVAVFCISAVVLAVLLRQYAREQSLLISLAVCTAVMGGLILFIEPVISDMRDIFSSAGISDSYISLLFKASAVCFITEITCELCKDSGESAVASAVELWGRGAVTFMSIPIIKSLIEQVEGLVSG